MTETEIKAKIYDLLMTIEQAKLEINQLQGQLSAIANQGNNE